MAPNGQPAATAECSAAPRGPGGGPSTPVAAVTRDAAALGPGAGTYVQAAGLKEAGHHGVLVSPQCVVDEVVPALGPEHPRGHIFASDRKAPGQKDTAHPWGPRQCRPKPGADTPRWRVETGQGCCLNPSVHLLGPGVSVDVCHCPSQGTAGGAPSTDQRALGAVWGACSSHLPDPPETPAERTLLTAETGPVGSGLRLSEDGRGLASGQPAYVAQTPVPRERDHCVLLTTAWWPPEDGRSRHPGGEEPPTPTTAPQMRRPGCSPHAGTEFVRDQVLLPGFSGQRQVVWTQPHPPGARPASGPQGAQGRTLRKLQGTATVTSASPRAAGHGRPFRPIRVSPGVLCPVNARGLIVRPKVGFVQDERVELPLPPGGVVQLSDVALCDDKLPTAETGATDTAHRRGPRPARGLRQDSQAAQGQFPTTGKAGGLPLTGPESPFSYRDPGQRRPVDSQGRTRHTLRAPPHLSPEQRPHWPVAKARTSSDSRVQPQGRHGSCATAPRGAGRCSRGFLSGTGRARGQHLGPPQGTTASARGEQPGNRLSSLGLEPAHTTRSSL